MSSKTEKFPIDRQALVRRHNPVLYGVDEESPFTVGNGEFAFTADITGFQSLYNDYKIFPLCTMSQWGWHTEPDSAGKLFSHNDLTMTQYSNNNRTLSYATLRHPGNEAVYDWLRHNPHRLNLARISMLWDGHEIQRECITGVKQELDLYTGVIDSEFLLNGLPVHVRTVCAQSNDIIGFSIKTSPLNNERLSVCISFPYGSPQKDASDWKAGEKHTTFVSNDGGRFVFHRALDETLYYVLLNNTAAPRKKSEHEYEFYGNTFTLAFSESVPEIEWGFDQVLHDSAGGWRDFWSKGGAADFSRAKDTRAVELERRTILSQYLTAAQCAGSTPPQETGLSCNSWYGKFHLEMHILHAGWFPLWGHGELLERSLKWYSKILGEARDNASRNGFSGARWPKMTGPEGFDSPSWIGTLLVWQQPSLIYMLELVRRTKPEHARRAFMLEHWELVCETMLFMCSFVQPDESNGSYGLPPPLIPAQEEHAPEITYNPTFELNYWRFGMDIAIFWAESLGMEHPGWRNIASRIAGSPMRDGLYLAHQNCPDTFTKFNRDHPSMLYSHGFIASRNIDMKAMSDTADRVVECWDRSSLWGWDFALCAMTFARLNRPADAVGILLVESGKNSYTTCGNNFQRGRDDLPLYLPGNGSLLFALSLMLAGYGEQRGIVGFPKNGLWEDISVEGISPLPF